MMRVSIPAGRAPARCGLAAALVALGAAGGTALAQETPTQAGVAAAVVNAVTVSAARLEAPAAVRSGMEMYLDDRIVTASDARLQVMLLDETVFTVGPGSDLVIDRFVYDPATGTGEVAATVATGFLRYVSGKVAAGSPERVRIDTPAATIGIRGSALLVGEDPDRPGTFFCAVLGPGLDNNALARRGACEIANDLGSTVVRREGFGAHVRAGEAPGPAVRLPDDLLERMQVALRPAPDGAAVAGGADPTGQDDTGRSVAQISGQPLAEMQRLSGEQGQLLASRFDILTGSTDTDVVEAVPPELRLTLPAFAQLTHNGAFDLDLHATGPNPDGEGRYHVFFANTRGPAGEGGLPAVELDAVRSTLPNSEVLTLNALNAGGVTRISVHNFSDQTQGGTTLADRSGALVSLLRNGLLERGPGGSVVIDGDLVTAVAPPAGGRGNTFVAFELMPDGSIDRVRGMTDSANPIDVQ